MSTFQRRQDGNNWQGISTGHVALERDKARPAKCVLCQAIDGAGCTAGYRPAQRPMKAKPGSVKAIKRGWREAGRHPSRTASGQTKRPSMLKDRHRSPVARILGPGYTRIRKITNGAPRRLYGPGIDMPQRGDNATSTHGRVMG
jgi:hypothetical protein